ncbi:hypothetical protein [Saccharothrix australiensis]|uniref:Peptidase inhibitor family I36 n=1 Tax=Saccharothrix australiensis TaxID=2072 RepID=A0A495VZ28_9PSEU|nr:hypothetical protein [Saccharothrix australiensis]RKT53987.1 hypothetical protein C8E97_2575 [Saccharothrix australiensis]
MKQRPVIRRLLPVLAAVTGLLLGTAGVGTAATPDEGTAFREQAAALGLSAEEADRLGSRADAYARQLGGTRTAINKVALGQGAELTLVLPGEAHARDLGAGGGVDAATSTCLGGFFCAWAGTYYQGDNIKWAACQTVPIPWYSDGSWINNQTTGTVAQFKSSDGVTRWASPAYDNDPVADWRWVASVKNC